MSDTRPQQTHRVVELYRRHAAGYDASARRTMALRRRTIDRLALQPGDTVLDVACGTGLSFEWLLDAVGPDGRVIGVELSPDMFQRAQQRVARHGWNRVTVLQSAMHNADLSPYRFDAILFNFTHDVLRSPAALQRIFAATRPGARVALSGMKYAPWWLAPINIIVRIQARPYMSSLEGLATPWNLATGYLQTFQRQSALFGTAYIGWGRTRSD